MPDKFSTAYYQAHAIPTAPNGDKLRSDDQGLFYWIEGERVPHPIPAGWVPRSQRSTSLEPEAVEPAAEPRAKATRKKPEPDRAAGEESAGDANGQ